MSTMTTTAPKNGTASLGNPQPTEQLPARPERVIPARLPFHKNVGEEFGITSQAWKALVEAVFPLAQAVDSVVLALSYCKARNLDPFKRVVHIVPIWSKEKGAMVDTIWPGIGELRTTAFRTGCYAGRGETVCGPDIETKVGKENITFPEWMQVTVKRLVRGIVVEFVGPRVYWLETYAQSGRNDASPNSMWSKRPRGQLEKCAEAASLRAAFPEELGDEHSVEECGIFTDKPLRTIEARGANGATASTTSQRLADELSSRRSTSNADQDQGETLEVFNAFSAEIGQAETQDELAEAMTRVRAAAEVDHSLNPRQHEELFRLSTVRADALNGKVFEHLKRVIEHTATDGELASAIEDFTKAAGRGELTPDQQHELGGQIEAQRAHLQAELEQQQKPRKSK